MMSDLQQITGIGPTRANRLVNEAGILTLTDLAAAEVGDVADLLGISEDAALAMIEEASLLAPPAGDPPTAETAVPPVYEHFLTGRVKQ